MKAYLIATVLAVTSISSVSSAMCMKKYLNSLGLNPSANTNFYALVKNKTSSSAARAAMSETSSNRQR